jgi:anti-sigma B factor antagonist
VCDLDVERRSTVAQTQVTMSVRNVSELVSIIDMQGEVTVQAENVLMDAYGQATASGARIIILNFSAMEYMNSGGIGLLVTLLIRVKRQQQRLLSFGLSEHYQHIFGVTRLNEAIGIYQTEAEAVAAAQAS